jgi:imidazolonepropionase-like amidohydrolase
VDQQFEKIYQVKHREVKKFYDAGGGRLITVGTDHPSWGEFLSGFGSHRELQALVASGIPPAAAIRMATINGARALNVAAKLGTIERGKLADLFVITGNPLADIRNTHKVRLVMKSGELFDSAALLASVKGKLGPASEADEAWWKGRTRFAAAPGWR